MGIWIEQLMLERRPVAPELSIEELWAWQAENCKSWVYIDPTRATNGYYRIVDNDGRVTMERDFRYGMELAAEKWKRGNE